MNEYDTVTKMNMDRIIHEHLVSEQPLDCIIHHRGAEYVEA